MSSLLNGLYKVEYGVNDAFGRSIMCMYSSADGRWKGEILNQEHTPAKGENPVFGGYEVGIGFSGTCDEAGAEFEAIALAGKRSLRLAATLKLMQPA